MITPISTIGMAVYESLTDQNLRHWNRFGHAESFFPVDLLVLCCL